MGPLSPSREREPLSAFVISYNRAERLRTCLKALAFADEIIVVDKSSTDDSVQIARALADRVVTVPWTPTVEETRGFALSLCKHRWVLCLDDDECLSPDAVLFIDAELRAPRADIYFLPQRHYILGRHDERAYYWPECQPRLFRRDAVAFVRTVHAGIVLLSERRYEIPAETGASIHHLSHRDVSEWIEKTNRYTSRPDRHSVEVRDDDLIAFAHARIEAWMGLTVASSRDDYPAAVALLRAVYDIVDRLKRWELHAGLDGAISFPRIALQLERGYAVRLANLGRPRENAQYEIARPIAAAPEAARELRVVDALGAALREARETAALELEAERARCRRELDEQRREAAERIARAEAELEAIRASTVWRLTHPLRRFGGRYPVLARTARRLLGLVRRPRVRRVRPEPVIVFPRTPAEARFGQERIAPFRPPLINRAEPEQICFPAAQAPVASVIVPMHGKTGFTLRCLASMARHLPAAPIEVIVIDDASADEEAASLGNVPGIRLIRNRENLGFLRSCNSAARVARGEFLLFLNNDTQVLPDWLDPMLELFRARPDAGIVGCKLLFPDGRLQEAGGIIWNDATGWTFGRGDDPGLPEYDYVREVDYVSGAALMVPRALFARLGGFDERFAPAYCEDADFAFRVRAARLKVLYQPRSCVVHFEGVSNGLDRRAGIRQYNEMNQNKLRAKWAAVLAADHHPPRSSLFRARERGKRRQAVLILARGMPEPIPSDPIFGCARSLLDFGLIVKIWTQGPAGPLHAVRALQELGAEVRAGDAPALRAWLEMNGRELDAVLLVDTAETDAVIADLRLTGRARLIHLAASPTKSAANAERERAIWRRVDLVIHASAEEAIRAGMLEPAVDSVAIDLGAAKALAAAVFDERPEAGCVPELLGENQALELA